jgi:hypothetical protein
MNQQKWIIQDWTGKHKFPDKVFNNFEDGIAFICEKFEDVKDREEFYVVPKEGEPDRE